MVLEEVHHTVEEGAGHMVAGRKVAGRKVAVVAELHIAGVDIGLVGVHRILAVEVEDILVAAGMDYGKAVRTVAAVGVVDSPGCTGPAVGILLVARILAEERGSHRSLVGVGSPEEDTARVEVGDILLFVVSVMSSSGK
jgi:hypothetical protein